MERTQGPSITGMLLWIVGVGVIGGIGVWLIANGIGNGSSVLTVAGLILVLGVARWIYNGIRFSKAMAPFTDIDKPNEQGFYPLHMAAAQGDANVVNILLANGALVDVEHTFLGFTPLHLAALEEHEDICLTLVAAGASPHALASDGRTPMDIAQEGGNERIMDIMGCE
jgi:hypothetical protein